MKVVLYIKIYSSCVFLHTDEIPLYYVNAKAGWSTTMRRLGDGKYDNQQRLGGGGKGGDGSGRRGSGGSSGGVGADSDGGGL